MLKILNKNKYKSVTLYNRQVIKPLEYITLDESNIFSSLRTNLRKLEEIGYIQIFKITEEPVVEKQEKVEEKQTEKKSNKKGK